MLRTEYGALWEKIEKALSPDSTWQDDMRLREYAKKVLTAAEYKTFRQHMKHIMYGGEIRMLYERINLDRFLREVFRK